jgi:hypothetical protein
LSSLLHGDFGVPSARETYFENPREIAGFVARFSRAIAIE